MNEIQPNIKGAHHRLWAIDPKALNLQALRKAPAKCEGPTPEEPAEPAEPAPLQIVNGAAVITITGVLMKYRSWVLDFFGGTATTEVTRDLRRAMADPSVERVVLVVDSPGGQVAGIADLADEIAEATKPVMAVVSDTCASGAYWLASQCETIIANPTALVGSIGVYECLVDSSKAAEEAGYSVKIVKAGQFKGLGEDGMPITPEQLAAEQVVIDDLYSIFVEAVSVGRGMTTDDVKKLATGEVYIASKAMAAGLIDAVGNLEDALAATAPAPEPAAPAEPVTATVETAPAITATAVTITPVAEPALEPAAPAMPAASLPAEPISAGIDPVRLAPPPRAGGQTTKDFEDEWAANEADLKTRFGAKKYYVAFRKWETERAGK